nr:envelope integrity protein Cei [Rhodococcus sp. HNM0569]
MITEGSSTDRHGRPFRRRRATPVIVLLTVFAVVAVAVWIRVLTTTSEASAASVTCNDPTLSQPLAPDAPTPPPLGERVDSDVLADVAPAPLSAAKVRVYNGNGEHGQAAQVAAELSDYGFASAPDVQAGNDPVYVDQNLQCQGQVRFGPNGLAAASAVWLVAPCAELIQDERTDDVVDLALGTYFGKLSPNTDADEVLRALAEASPDTEAAPLDPDLLAAARSARC